MSSLPTLLGWLAFGGFLAVLSGGRLIIPVAMWLTPVVLLHAARSHPGFTTILLIWGVTAVAMLVINRGVLPMSGIAYVGVSAAMALPLVVSITADRFLATRVTPALAVFAFPLVWTSIHFLNARFASFGSWGAPAYTQFGNLPLLQLVSVTGISGITFLIGWFASTVNVTWDRGWSAGVTLPFVLTTLVVITLGSLRVARERGGNLLRVATISYSRDGFIRGEVTRFLRDELANDERASVHAKVTRLQARYLEDTRHEARAGAALVVWPEVNLLVAKEDELAFLDEAREVARSEHIYLSMGLGVVEHGAHYPLQNKEVLIDPAGDPIYVHHKSHLVAGWEVTKATPGQRLIPVIDTEIGRIASAICFEMDFPSLIRQAGVARADLIIAPSNDWQEIRDVHLAMAVFRAIENGVSLVRATSSGLSTAVDRVGRTYALGDDAMPNGRVMLATLPIGGKQTIYSRVGDLFGWLCVAGLGALFAVALL